MWGVDGCNRASNALGVEAVDACGVTVSRVPPHDVVGSSPRSPGVASSLGYSWCNFIGIGDAPSGCSDSDTRESPSEVESSGGGHRYLIACGVLRCENDLVHR